MILKRKSNKQPANASPAKKSRPARKLFQPEVRPLDAGVSPLLALRRPHRSIRPLAVLAISLGLVGWGVGQETNRLAYTVIRTNGAGAPEQVILETNTAVEDVVVFRQEPGPSDLGTNAGPVVVRLPEDAQGPPLAPQEPVTRPAELQPGEPESNSQAAVQVQPVNEPQPQPTSSPATSGASPVVALERGSTEGTRRRSEYRNSTRREENRTSTAAVQQKGDHTAAKTVEDFSAFRIVAERNIFNPNRRYYRPGESRPKPRQVDSFSLVGVMSYEKGTFAFFDGSASDFKKVLKASDKIANYTISEIAPNGVKLDNGGKELELRVGAQLRREDQGEWTLSNEAQTYAGSSTASSNTNPSAVPEAASGADADVLKRLMLRRDQE